jgi:flavodoxin I
MSNILVAYGSLTGNTQMVAERITDHCKSQGHSVTLQNIGELTPDDLLKYEVLVLGSSTWDDGQLQMDAQAFFEQCSQPKMDLSTTVFTVFGCGDSSYNETFCRAVDTLTGLLKESGSKQLIPELKVDGFPEMPENIAAIEQWSKQLTDSVKTV